MLGPLPTSSGASTERPLYKTATNYTDAKSQATGTVPFLIVVADNGDRPTPGRDLAFYDPSQTK